MEIMTNNKLMSWILYPPLLHHLSDYFFFSINVYYWLWPDGKVALLEQGSHEIDGQSSEASPTPRTTSELLPLILLHHSTFISSPTSFIFLAATYLVSRLFIHQSDLITALQVQGIKGFSAHKLSSKWISSRENFIEKKKMKDRMLIKVMQAEKCKDDSMKWCTGWKKVKQRKTTVTRRKSACSHWRTAEDDIFKESHTKLIELPIKDLGQEGRQRGWHPPIDLLFVLYLPFATHQ